jgi:hypothetical protein
MFLVGSSQEGKVDASAKVRSISVLPDLVVKLVGGGARRSKFDETLTHPLFL